MNLIKVIWIQSSAILLANIIQAMAIWGISVSLAREGGAIELGRFTLAVAIASPVVGFFSVSGMTYLTMAENVSAALQAHLVVKIISGLLALIVCSAIALLHGDPNNVALVITVTGWKIIESASQLYYGAMQRFGQHRNMATSIVLRSVLNVSFFYITLKISNGDLLISTASLVAGSALVLYFYDSRIGRAIDSGRQLVLRELKHVIISGLPLGVSTLLYATVWMSPRYLIEHYFGTGELGNFAAVAQFITLGTMIINPISFAAFPKLVEARLAHQFHRVHLVTMAFGVIINLPIAIAVALYGPELTRVVFGADIVVSDEIALAVGVSSMLVTLGLSALQTMVALQMYWARLLILLTSLVVMFSYANVVKGSYGPAGLVWGWALALSIQFVAAELTVRYKST